jgi:hypothetical protein
VLSLLSLRRCLAIAGLVIAASGVAVLALADHDSRADAGAPGSASGSLPRLRGWPHRGEAGRTALPAATVTVTAGSGRAVAVPRSFLGLSTEYQELPAFERHPADFDRVLAFLRPPEGGSLLLRVGGDSADRSFWSRPATPLPRWALALHPGWLRHTNALVRRTGVRLLLDLNLLTGSAARAAAWTAAAERGLPRRSIVGLEIGNEPDLYNRRAWLAATDWTRLGAALIPRAMNSAIYNADFAAYARTLNAVAPGLPLAGPAIANAARHIGWIQHLLAAPHPGLGTLTAHIYPLSACAKPRAATFPTIARILAPQASTDLGARIRLGVLDAHRAGLRFRVTELNSVTCGGRPGVSNSFATALWAPEALFELLRTGVDGVNIHVRDDTVNAAFALGPRGLLARPLLYGLLTFERALGPGAKLLPISVRTSAESSVHVWAIRVHGAMHVLVINPSRELSHVALHFPAQGPATVQRLEAPSPAATSGVTLGGRWLSSSARWVGAKTTESLAPVAHTYSVAVPRDSAALVSLRVPERTVR